MGKLVRVHSFACIEQTENGLKAADAGPGLRNASESLCALAFWTLNQQTGRVAGFSFSVPELLLLLLLLLLSSVCNRK